MGVTFSNDIISGDDPASEIDNRVLDLWGRVAALFNCSLNDVLNDVPFDTLQNIAGERRTSTLKLRGDKSAMGVRVRDENGPEYRITPGDYSGTDELRVWVNMGTWDSPVWGDGTTAGVALLRVTPATIIHSAAGDIDQRLDDIEAALGAGSSTIYVEGTGIDLVTSPPGYPTNSLQIGINTSGASSGDFLKYNGSTVEWGVPSPGTGAEGLELFCHSSDSENISGSVASRVVPVNLICNPFSFAVSSDQIVIPQSGYYEVIMTISVNGLGPTDANISLNMYIGSVLTSGFGGYNTNSNVNNDSVTVHGIVGLGQGETVRGTYSVSQGPGISATVNAIITVKKLGDL